MYSSNPKNWLVEPHQTDVVTVVLHGRLAKQFGRRHRLGVSTASEAVYALCMLHDDFRAAIEEGAYRVVRGTVKTGLPLSEQMLDMRIGSAGEIHFIPVAAGKKNGGIGKIILGVVLIAVAIVALPGVGGGLGASISGGLSSVGISAGSLAFFGASLVLAGISQVISPQPKSALAVDPKNSFGLTGATNSISEGSAIPVVYGRQRVGSVVASFGYSAEDYAGTVTSNQNAGVVFLPGSPLPFPTTGPVGAGGGGKGGGGTSGGATEAPNTLRSNAVVRVVDILSEGPIGGLADGAKSIFFNGTPLQASDGTYNFQGVSWEVRLGYPDQTPISGYPAVEQTLAQELGLPFQLKQSFGPKSLTVTSTTATAARLTMRIPQLFTQDAKNGNLVAGPNLQYKIEVQPVGGNYTQVVAESLVGQKCISPYQRSYRFDLPRATDANRATSWNIRITRLTGDDTASNSHSETYIDAVTLITDHQISYSNTAYIALTIDASAFGSQIPTRAYEIDGIVCQVPLNYDPVNHTYATTGPGTSMGSWDGASWKPAVTSNPAWCLYDILSSTRYGMALPAKALVATKYDLFPISQYCDGKVPSGFKDEEGADILELRYSLNVAMTTQEDAYRVIQSMVSSFRGLTYWGAGRVVVTADMPVQPVSILNQANVVDGAFSYEGTDLKSRHTVARVTWQDPSNSYRTSIEVYEDFDAVVTRGQVPADIQGFGVTSRGLARRLGKWLLETEKHQTETMSAKAGLEHLRVRPGDIVKVSDPAFVGQVMGGRCAAGSNVTAVILDRVIEGPSDLTYKLSVSLPDGTVETVPCSFSAGIPGHTILDLQVYLSQAPVADASWVLTSTGSPGKHGNVYAIEPRQFRIAGVMEQKRAEFSLIGLLHDPNKYARVEYGLQFDPTPYSALGQILATPLPPPSNVYARDYMVGVGNTTVVRVTVSCTAANDPRVIGTQFRVAGPEQRLTETTTDSSYDFDNLQLGNYVFGARSMGRDGRASVWVDSATVLVDGLADPPSGVTGLTAQGDAMSVDISFVGSDSRDLLHYELWRSPAPTNGVHPFNLAGFTPTGTPASNGASLVATFDATRYHDSGDILGPDKAWAYWVRAINTTLVAGPFAGPVKALTTYYLTNNLEESIRNTAIYAASLLGGTPTIVANLNTAGTREGQLVFLSTDQKLYSWDATHQRWNVFIPLIPDSTGKLTPEQSAAIANTTISGSLTPEQTQALIAGISAGGITSDKIASIVADKVTGTLGNATIFANRVYDVDPITGQSVVGVSTEKLLGSIQGGKVVGALSNATLQGSAIRDVDPLTQQQVSGLRAARIAGQLVASQISAGAITTEKLSVGSPDNVIANSCFSYSSDGWTGVAVTPVIGTAQEANYTPTADGAGLAVTGVLAPNTFADLYYNAGRTNNLAYSAPIPCVPGETWEAQICFFPIAGSVTVTLLFADANGGLPYAPSSGPATYAPPANGKSLTSWRTIGVAGTAPTGTVAVGILIRLTNTGTVSAPASAYLTRALLGRTVPNATALLGWVPGGVASITGGLIQSDSIKARAIKANQIGAREIAVGNSANAIWNSCLGVATDGWSVYASGTSTATLASCSTTLTPYQTSDGCGNVIFNLNAVDYIDISWSSVTCVAGETLEYQATVLPMGCSAFVYLQYFSTTGAPAGYSAPSPTIASQPGPLASSVGDLSVFRLTGMTDIVPTGAVRAVFKIRLATTTSGSGTFLFTRTSLGRTFAGATQISPWAPGGVTTLSGGILASESVVTRTIQAGAIKAEKLAIASAANVIWNSTCKSTSDGWINLSTVTSDLGSVIGDGLAGSNFALATYGTGALRAASLLPGQGLFAVWDPENAYGQPVLEGEWWEASAYLAAHRCWGRVRFEFLTATGQQISNNTFSGERIAGPLGGTDLSGYGFSWCKGQAPTGAKRVRLVIDAFNDNGSDIVAGSPGANPFLFFTKVLLGPSVPLSKANGAQPQLWQPGGITQITPGMLSTNSVIARSISAGAIDATKLSVGSPSNLIWNGCCGQSGAGWRGDLKVTAVLPGPYYLPGFGTGQVATTAIASGGYYDVFWAPNDLADGTIYKADGVNNTVFSAAIPCTPGVGYEAQVKVNTHRCSVEVYLLFVSADGNSLPYAPSAGSRSFPQTAGKVISDYTQISVRGVAPAGSGLMGLLMRIRNDSVAQAVFGSNSGVSPFLFFTQAALGPYLPNVSIMPWGPGGNTVIDGGMVKAASIQAIQLAAGSVTAGAILAGSVTTNALAASSVTAEKATFGSPSNVIWNSAPDQTIDGWYPSTFGLPAYGAPNVFMGPASLISPGYALSGYGSMYSQYTGAGAVGSNQYMIWDWLPNGASLGVPCAENATYAAAASLICGNAGARIELAFFSYNGTLLTGGSVSQTVSNNVGQNGGVADSQYTRVGVKGVSPAGAVFVRMRIAIFGVGAAGPVAVWTKAQLGQIPTGGVIPDWVPGGITTLSGDMIKTGTLDATRIRAKTITAGQIAAQTITGTEIQAGSITANKIAANTITGDQIAANAIKAGQIQAGAVAADQIAANQLHGYHLAADFALISSAQIGYLTVDTANIRDLIVTGSKISNGAVSAGSGLQVNPVYRPPLDSQWHSLGHCDFNSAGPTATHVVVVKSRNEYTPPVDDTPVAGQGGGEGGGDGGGY